MNSIHAAAMYLYTCKSGATTTANELTAHPKWFAKVKRGLKKAMAGETELSVSYMDGRNMTFTTEYAAEQYEILLALSTD